VSNLTLKPITFRQAATFVNQFHSHHTSPQGHIFSIGIIYQGELVGVVIAGLPPARKSRDGYTLEVTRLCVKGHVKNAASMLYGAAWRAAKALGYTKMLTYTLAEEEGISTIAAGFKSIGMTRGGSWSRAGRERKDKHPLGLKTKWEMKVNV